MQVANDITPQAIINETSIRDSLKNSTILIVDDMQFNLLVIKEAFNSNGFENLILSKDGRDAIEKTKQLKPDLVILDLVMPELDGFEYCKAIRQIPEFNMLPIIVQTVATAPQQKARAFECGATDFINKPIDKDELIARSLVHLERNKLYFDLKNSSERMAQELNEAKNMQDVLMPSEEQIKLIEEKYSLKLCSYFQTSSELGGDFWGAMPINEDKFALFIVDFAGHGVTAALNIFRLHTLMGEHDELFDNPTKFMSSLNKSLNALLKIGQYATMFYGVVDLKKNRLTYTTAGCPSPLIYNSLTQKVEEISGKGFPLGIYGAATYDEYEIPFEKGSLLFLYSDALIETPDLQGRFLDTSEINKVIADHLTKNADVIGNTTKLYENIMNLFNKKYIPYLSDDLTLNIYSRFA